MRTSFRPILRGAAGTAALLLGCVGSTTAQVARDPLVAANATAAGGPEARLLTLAADAGPGDGNFLSQGPAGQSFCQTIGCNPGRSFASLLTQMTTVGDGTRQEIGHAINVTNNAGYRTAADTIDNGVEGLFIGLRATAGGAKSWGQATDLVLDKGYASDFAAIGEFDLSNDAYDCPPGGKGPDGQSCNIFGLWVGGYVGAHPSTAALFVSPVNRSEADTRRFAHHYGIAFEGVNAVKEATFVDGTDAQASLQTTGHHAIAVFNDASTSPAGINLAGTYALAAINLSESRSAVALAARQGQGVCFNGSATCLVGTPAASRQGSTILAEAFAVKRQLTVPFATPASSAAPCATGQVQEDASYHYVCIAPNHWRRVALSDF